MHKDTEEEIKIYKKYRTFYCDCCGEKICKLVESNHTKGYFHSEILEDKMPHHFIRIEPDDRNTLKLEGDFCNKCWDKLNDEVKEFFTVLYNKYSRAAQLLNT